MANIDAWHAVVKNRDPQALSELIADQAVFHSPLVHTPQTGKTLLNDSFRYVREVHDGRHSVLEFVVELDGIAVNGVDMIQWDEDGKIIDFKVMIRPYKAIEVVRTRMAAMLEKLK